MAMTSAAFAACAAFAVAGAGADLRSRRVPDALVAGALAIAMAIAGVESGAAGILRAGLGGTIGFAVLLPGGLAGILGGGDVKFAAAAGAFLGPARAFQAALFGVLLAGLVLAAAQKLRGPDAPTLPV